MSEVNCSRAGCRLVAIIGSVIVGIIAAILTFTATITVAPVLYWVTFGIALLFLAIILAVTLRESERRYCLCPVLNILLAGILGTVLTALILLGVGFAATSVLGAIITGALLFFFSLVISSTVCIVKCLSGCRG